MGRPASNGLWWFSLKEVSAPPARNPDITDALMRQGPVRGFFRTDRHLPTSGRTIRGHRLRKWGYCERHTARAVKADSPFRPSP